jgi:site-specific DNA-methyltransferase (adenine-specific)
MQNIQARLGDCVEVMRGMKENSIDSIVCDPPYLLSFMGKSWDTVKDKSEMQSWHYAWAIEALRVAKPGAHLLAFGGTRTYHRLVCALEDAGWEIRDAIMWVYGSGFPKSLNVGKDNDGWSGWGTALKPACEPIVLARKPISEKTITKNVLKWGTGAINIDKSRVEISKTDPGHKNYHQNRATVKEYRVDNSLYELGMKTVSTAEHPQGRWPANFIHDGSEEVVELFPQSKTTRSENPSDCRTEGNTSFDSMRGNRPPRGYSEEGSAARFFYCAKASKKERDFGLNGIEQKLGIHSNAPRNSEEEKTKSRINNHPTVKPIALMKYLITMITPPNGIVLDPFLGSGTTLVAAKELGFSGRGIEQDSEYIKIAKERIFNAATKENE